MTTAERAAHLLCFHLNSALSAASTTSTTPTNTSPHIPWPTHPRPPGPWYLRPLAAARRTQLTRAVPQPPPVLEPLQRLQLPRIRQAQDARRVPRAPARERPRRCRGSAGAWPEGPADAEGASRAWKWSARTDGKQRQTLLSNFYQFDRLVIEGQTTGRQKDGRGDLARVSDTG